MNEYYPIAEMEIYFARCLTILRVLSFQIAINLTSVDEAHKQEGSHVETMDARELNARMSCRQVFPPKCETDVTDFGFTVQNPGP